MIALKLGLTSRTGSVDFGFPVAIHPRDPDRVYAIPVESDEFRCACDGRLRVYRTRNAGASWEPMMQGLPRSAHMKRCCATRWSRTRWTLSESISAHVAANCLDRTMKAKAGNESSGAYLQSSVSVAPWLRKMVCKLHSPSPPNQYAQVHKNQSPRLHRSSRRDNKR